LFSVGRLNQLLADWLAINPGACTLLNLALMVTKKGKKRKLVKLAFDELSLRWYDWGHE
jgi:hypothetical protein